MGCGLEGRFQFMQYAGGNRSLKTESDGSFVNKVALFPQNLTFKSYILPMKHNEEHFDTLDFLFFCSNFRLNMQETVNGGL